MGRSSKVRQHAVSILADFDRENRRLSNSMDDYFRSHGLAPEDRPAVTHLVQETTRWRGYLDYLLSDRYRGNYHKTEYKLRNVLRLGAYEILFSPHVPRYAVVNESVNLSKTMVGNEAAGLTNAILRSLRSADRPDPGKLTADDPPNKVAAITSHPDWMIERWMKDLGFERTVKLCAWNNRSPSFTVRRNRLALDRKEFEGFLERQNVSWKSAGPLQEFYEVDHLSRLIRTREFLSGHFSVQDMSGGLVVHLVGPEEGWAVLDVCAAPGGKTTYLAEIMGNKGTVHAYDVDETRLALLMDNCERLGLNSVQISRRDATADRFPEGDAILMDVPCSGTGVLSKRADLRWRRQETHIVEMQSLQLQMLSHVSRFVRPGGRMVYATCSLEKEENWEVIDLFLDQDDHFKVVRGDRSIPGDYLDDRGALHTFPPEHEIDGVFGVILRREL